MDNLNSAIKDIFETFHTDLSGIRVKKFLKLVRAVQHHLPDVKEKQTLHTCDNGQEIVITPHNGMWELSIGEASIAFDKHHVYDLEGNVTHGSFLAPAAIQTILAA